MTFVYGYRLDMTADPPWLVAVATLFLAAVSWWAPIREMEAPWPAMVGFYGGSSVPQSRAMPGIGYWQSLASRWR